MNLFYCFNNKVGRKIISFLLLLVFMLGLFYFLSPVFAQSSTEPNQEIDISTQVQAEFTKAVNIFIDVFLNLSVNPFQGINPITSSTTVSTTITTMKIEEENVTGEEEEFQQIVGEPKIVGSSKGGMSVFEVSYPACELIEADPDFFLNISKCDWDEIEGYLEFNKSSSENSLEGLFSLEDLEGKNDLVDLNFLPGIKCSHHSCSGKFKIKKGFLEKIHFSVNLKKYNLEFPKNWVLKWGLNSSTVSVTVNTYYTITGSNYTLYSTKTLGATQTTQKGYVGVATLPKYFSWQVYFNNGTDAFYLTDSATYQNVRSQTIEQGPVRVMIEKKGDWNDTLENSTVNFTFYQNFYPDCLIWDFRYWAKNLTQSKWSDWVSTYTYWWSYSYTTTNLNIYNYSWLTGNPLTITSSGSVPTSATSPGNYLNFNTLVTFAGNDTSHANYTSFGLTYLYNDLGTARADLIYQSSAGYYGVFQWGDNANYVSIPTDVNKSRVMLWTFGNKGNESLEEAVKPHTERINDFLNPMSIIAITGNYLGFSNRTLTYNFTASSNKVDFNFTLGNYNRSYPVFHIKDLSNVTAIKDHVWWKNYTASNSWQQLTNYTDFVIQEGNSTYFGYNYILLLLNYTLINSSQTYEIWISNDTDPGGGDTQSPQYSNCFSNVTNNTAVSVSTPIELGCQWNDNVELSMYVNSSRINDTSWQNGTWQSFTSGNWTNFTVVYPASAQGGSFSVKIFANDSSNNQNVTGVWYWYNLTGYCDYTIDSCSVLDQTGKTYCLNQSIIDSSSSACMNISADNVILDCQGYTIDGNDAADYGIYLYRNSAENTNVMIKNCVITDWDTQGIYLYNSSNNTLENISLSSNPDDGIRLQNSSNNYLRNITSNNNHRGIVLYYSSNNSITNNTVNYNNYGIYISSSLNNTLTNNNISSYHNSTHKQQGLFVWGSDIQDFRNNINESNTINDKPILYIDGIIRTCPNNTVYTNGSSYGYMGFVGCNNITVKDSSPTDQLLLAGTTNSTISNLNISFTRYAFYLTVGANYNTLANSTTYKNSNYGIWLEYNSSYNTLTNNTANSSDCGIMLELDSNYNTLINNTANSNLYGIYLSSSFNNTLTNNIINFNNYGFYIDSSSNNNITGGSIALSGDYQEYYLVGAGGTNNFTNTNFTASRNIYFEDSSSWFNYRNTSNGIWLKTRVSATAKITRSLLKWSQTEMKWNEAASATITAFYNLTGLIPSQQYKIYNGSQLVYTQNTDSAGNLNFNLTITTTARNITVNTSDSTAPIYSLNSTNSTQAGSAVEHRLKWQDNVGLSGYIFSFDNCTQAEDNSNYTYYSEETGKIAWEKAWDTAYQGMYVEMNRDWTISRNDKSIIGNTFYARGYIQLYDRTGNETYLLWARNITDALWTKAWNVTSKLGFIEEYNRSWYNITCNQYLQHQADFAMVALDIYNRTGNTTYYNWANQTMDFIMSNYHDSTYGGFYDVRNGCTGTISNTNKHVESLGAVEWALMKWYRYTQNSTAKQWSEETHEFIWNWLYDTTYDGFMAMVNQSGNGIVNDRKYPNKEVWGIAGMLEYYNQTGNTTIRNRIHTILNYTNATMWDWNTTACPQSPCGGWLRSLWRNNTIREDTKEGWSQSEQPWFWYFAHDMVGGNESYLQVARMSTNWTRDYNFDNTYKGFYLELYRNGTCCTSGSEEKYDWVEGGGMVAFAYVTTGFISSYFENDTWEPFSGTGNWSNVTKTINSTVGCTIRWCVYANDTSNNWNSTSCQNPFSYVTTSAGYCDYEISSCSNLDQAGKTYCLNQSIIDSSSTACMNISASNITLDCQGFRIDGTKASSSYGINISRSSSQNTNITIKNCNVTEWYYGIYLRNASSNSIINSTAYNNSYGFRLYSSSNNNTLTNNTANYNSYGFGLYSNSNNTLTNNTANYNSYYGFYLESNSNYNTLTNNTANYNSNYGFYLSSSSNNTLVNNKISVYHNSTHRQQGLFVWGSNIQDFRQDINESNTINDLPILYIDGIIRACPNNTVYTNGSSYGYMGFVGCSNITVKDSSLTDHLLLAGTINSTISNLNISFTRYAFYLTAGANYNNITNCIAYNNTYYGFFLYSSSNNTLTNNTANYNSDGFYLESSSNNTLTNNTANYNSGDGFFLYSSSNNTLTNNIANYNSGSGFWQDWISNNNIFINNTANYNSDSGFYILYSDYNTFTNNTANNNSWDGFSLDSSDRNTFTNNTVNNNSYDGFYLLSSYYNTFTNNTVNYNSWGFYLDSSSNNNITGGSIALSGSYDYAFGSAGGSNNFTSTNFTASRKIYFYDSSSWFNYRNTSGGIWLKTRVSARTNITRSLFKWSQTEMKWNEQANSTITAYYNLTGLIPSQTYYIYNGSSLTYTQATDSQGNLNFNLTITTTARDITVNTTVYCDYTIDSCSDLDQAGKTYCLNQSITDSSATACMNISASNITLDCQGFRIDGTKAFLSYGINISRSSSQNTNITIKNCNVTEWYNGIYLNNASSNSIINSTAYNNSYGFRLYSSSNNTLTNNTANYNSGDGFLLSSSSNYNTLTNNTANYNGEEGFLLSSSSNNTLANNKISVYHNSTYNQLGLYVTGSSISDFRHNINESNTINDKPILYIDGIIKTCPNNTVYTNGSSYSYMGFVGCENITVKDSSPTDHLLLAGTIKSTISNLNISFTGYIAFYLAAGANYNTFTNNTANYNDYYGFYLYSSSNNTFVNNTVNYNDYRGFYLSSSSNNTFINNTVEESGCDGFLLSSSSNNTFINNNVNNNSEEGFYLGSSSNNTFTNNNVNYNGEEGFQLYNSSYNTFTNNTVNNNYYGFYLSSSSNNNTITGGSIALSGSYDYYLSSAGSDNNFTNTNFTASRKIYFYDSSSWFNYRNVSNGIWLKTRVSGPATITRSLLKWSQTEMKWNETASTTITAYYNFTGLIPSQQYKIYNGSQLVYTQATDSAGNLNFNLTITTTARNITVNTSFSISQTITASFSSARTSNFFRSLAQYFTGNFGLSRIYSFLRSLIQSITANFSKLRTITIVRSVFQIISSNFYLKRTAEIFTTARQSITSNFLASRISTIFKSVSQAFTMNIYIKRITTIFRTAGQSITINLSKIRVAGFFRNLSQAISSGFYVKRISLMARQVNQAITTNLSVSRIATVFKNVTQNIIFNFSRLRISTTVRSAIQSITSNFSIRRVAGIIRNRTLSITTNFSLAKSWTYVRAAIQSITANFSIRRIASITRAITQSITANFSKLRIASITKKISLTITENFSIAKVANIFKILTQSITSNFSVRRIALMVRGSTQSITYNLSITRITSIFKSTSQMITVNLGIARISSIFRSISQSVTTNFYLAKSWTYVRAAAQTIIANFSKLRMVGFIRSRILSITSNWAISKSYAFVRNRTITITTNFSIRRVAGIIRNRTLSITTNFSLAKSWTYVRAAIQSITTNLYSARVSNFIRRISQTITQNLFVARVSNMFKILSQPITTNILLKSYSSFVRSSHQSFTTFFSLIAYSSKTITNYLSISLNSAAQRTALISRGLVQTITTNLSIRRVAGLLRYSSQQLFTSFSLSVGKAINIMVSASFGFNSRITSAYSFLRSISQTMTPGLAIGRIGSHFRFITQTITSNIYIVRAASMLRSAVQSITSGFYLTKSWTYVRSAAQAITSNLSLTRVAVIIRSRMLSITTNFYSARITSFFRLITQPITANFYLTKSWTYVRSAAQAITTNFSLRKIASIGRVVAQTITTNFSLTRITSILRSATQAITSNIFVVRAASLFKYLTQSITASFSIFKSWTYVRSAAQAITSNLSIASVGSFFRTITQSITSNFYISRIATLFKNLSQAITTNIFSIKAASMLRSAVQSITSSLALTKISSISRIAAQTITTNTFVTRISLLTKAFSQVITTNIFAARTASIFKFLSQFITANFAISKSWTYIRSAAQSFTTSLSATRIAQFVKEISQPIIWNLAISRISNIYKSLAQIISTNIFVSSISSFNRLVSQALTTNVFVSSFSLFARSVSQAITSSFGLSRFANFIRDLAQPLTYNLWIKGISSFIRSTVQGITLDSSIFKSWTYVRAAVQYITANLSIATFSSFVREITQAITANFVLTRISALFLSVSQQISLSVFIERASSFTRIVSQMIMGEFASTAFKSLTIFISQPITVISSSLRQFSAMVTQSLPISLTTISGRVSTIFREIVSFFTLSSIAKGVASFNIAAFVQFTTNLASTAYRITLHLIDVVLSLNISSFSERLTSLTRTIAMPVNISIIQTRVASLYVNIINIIQFFLQGLMPPPPSGPPVSVGGGGVVPAAPIVPPPVIYVKFIKQPVLREVTKGQAVLEDILIKNIGNTTLEKINIEVGGIPSIWALITPNNFSLKPNETKAFNLLITVPEKTNEGDYSVILIAKSGNAQDKTFFILRVKSFVPEVDKAVVTRYVMIDLEEKKTFVTLSLFNGYKTLPRADLIENIKKTITSSLENVEFINKPDEIIQKDPILRWSLLDVEPRSLVNLSYIIKTVLPEFSHYVYWPLEELSILFIKTPYGISITKILPLELVSGWRTQASITIENLENVSKNVTLTIRLPEGWELQPGSINYLLSTREIKTFTFSIRVPPGTQLGYYVGGAVIDIDGNLVIREYQFVVISWWEKILKILILPLGLLVSIIIAFLVVKRVRKRRRAERERIRERVEKLKAGEEFNV